MSTEQISVKSHYRTLHNGKVVYVHDYHAGHEVSHKSRAAHFHERTAMGKHQSGATYLRATDDADAAHIRRAATELGIGSSEETREADHHGNRGRFTHFDFATPEDAALVMHMAESKATPHEEPIPKELGSHDELFAQIFGDVRLPDEVDQPEWDAQFASIYGDIPEVGMRRGVTLTAADLQGLQADFGLDAISINGQATFIDMWNRHIKLDIREALGPIIRELNKGVPGSHSKSLTLGAGHDSMAFSYGDQGISCSRHYDFNAKTVDHSLWSLPSSIRGDGLGKKVFQESFRFYEAAGIKKVTVHANIDVGSYCWARYRFRPNDARNWGILKNAFSGSQHTALVNSPEAQEILAMTDTRGAWALVDYISKKVKLGEKSKADHGGRITPEARAQGAIGRNENPLLHLHWYGHIDLTDQDQMGHLWDYISDKPSQVEHHGGNDGRASR